MNDSRNSGASRHFETLVAALLLVLAGVGALTWCLRENYLLYYGDAVAHLNIARRIVDSRTPGYPQIGTVWLPLPHLLMLPLVSHDGLWRSGLAGGIPATAFYAFGGVFFFAGLRRVFGRVGAAAGTAAFALNPNLLYLQALPMTEAIFAGCLGALFYFTVRFRQAPSLKTAAAAGAAALAGSLTRYEGWFLIPFVAAYLLVAAKPRRWGAALLFAAIASAGPLYWLAHNLWFYGDALEFYRGPWSAQAIYQRALDSGMAPYPGDGDLLTAARYYLAAARLCAGWPLAALGTAGALAAAWRRKWWPVALLALPPVFYIWSLHSGGTPIFVPHLWPHSWYNTRYGLAGLPLLATGVAALASTIPPRFRKAGAAGLLAAVLLPWTLSPAPESWICWKESQVNSEQRRAWTREAAAYLERHYTGGGIIHGFGDLTGIFLEAGIPLRETVHEGNTLEFYAAIGRPDLFLDEEWAVAISGDPVATAILRSQRSGPEYECVKMIALKDAPVIEIYRRK